MKKRFSLANFMFNMIVALAVAFVAGINPMYAAIGSVAIGTGLSFVEMPKGAAFAGVQKEIWTDRLMENFYPNTDFLSRSQDMSPFVENNTINLTECGVDPNVLVDNDSYPIPVAQRTDAPIALPLSTLDTENTLVRNVEQMKSSYDKMGSVLRQHQSALRKKAGMLAAYNWAPAQDGGNNFVLNASGANGALTFEDILKLSGRYNDLDAPQEGRVLLLSPTHREQLMEQDIKMYKRVFEDNKPLFGFAVYVFSKNPTYTGGVRNAYGAAGDIASIAWLETEVMRAQGSIEMFADLKNPYERGDIVGFQMRFAGLSIRKKYSGALVSATA